MMNKQKNAKSWITLLCSALIVWFAFGPVASAQTLTGSAAQARMQQVIADYQDARKVNNSWGLIQSGRIIEPGQREDRIPQIRRRVAWPAQSGDTADASSEVYDEALQAAVIDFQRRHGVLADGRIGNSTVLAMNVPIESRIVQLELGLERMREFRKQMLASRYVVVNIPSQELFAVDSDRIDLVSTVIVGRRNRPTPKMQATITGVSFQPTWTVPARIAKHDLFPKLHTDPQYFVRRKYQLMRYRDNEMVSPQQIVDQKLQASEVRFRQSPGPRNPLGRIKIEMPNQHAIFLHDTPVSQLYGWPNRLLSSGCVRVARIVELAAWVLQGTAWDLARISTTLHSGTAIKARQPAGIPVHLIYLTAFVDSAGAANFRDDIYGLNRS